MKKLALIPALAILLAACNAEAPDAPAVTEYQTGYHDGYVDGAADVKCPGPAPEVKRQVVPPKKAAKKAAAKKARVKEAWEICLDGGGEWKNKVCIRIPKPTGSPSNEKPKEYQAP